MTVDLDATQQACWVAGQYGDITFRDGDGCGPTFELLFSRVVNALRDSNLPVALAIVSHGFLCIPGICSISNSATSPMARLS